MENEWTKPENSKRIHFSRLNLINWLYCKEFKYQGYEQY